MENNLHTQSENNHIFSQFPQTSENQNDPKYQLLVITNSVNQPNIYHSLSISILAISTFNENHPIS